jgi:hypothetical protein
LIIGIALVTSLVLIVLARRAGWPWRRLRRAGVIALETIGATVLLFAINVALGSAAVLLGRRFTPFYASLYLVSDVALLIVSLVQALVLQAWRIAARDQ